MRSVYLQLRYLALVLFILVTAGSTFGQSDRGTLAGTVLDGSGGVVANAQIVAKGTDTGSVYTATSGPTGGFRFPDVKIGLYSLTVSAPGFKTETKTGVEVQVNSVASVSFALTLGDVKETLTIIADAPAIQTESSDIGTVVGKR